MAARSDGVPVAADDPLSATIDSLMRLTPAVAGRLQRLELLSVRDLLFHLPMRYMDQTQVTPMDAMEVGVDALVAGECEGCAIRYFGRRRVLEVGLSDECGFVLLRFFHFFRGYQQRFRAGARLRCYGRVRAGRRCLEMIHPEVKSVPADGTVPVDDRLTPVYPSTEGLRQDMLRRLIDKALQIDSLADCLNQLPPAVLSGTWLPLDEALRLVHQPPPGLNPDELVNGTHPAIRRLAFEELLAHQTVLLMRRRNARQHKAPELNGNPERIHALIRSLPFSLTGAQQRVWDEIAADMTQPVPMLRLLQGDVGSGKTVVAALAAARALDAGCQCCIMVPTELLAQQHLRNLRVWLEPFSMECLLLTGRSKAAERRAGLQRIESGDPVLVIGTHALIQEHVSFPRLGLIVIDEQHRFGVQQRLHLLYKGSVDNEARPHQLIMTATPIPRTLAMTMYTDLDLSVLDELPVPKRIKTAVISAARRDDVLEKVRTAVADKRRIYWVCNLIDESEMLDARPAVEVFEQLRKTLPDMRLALLHGRMKSGEKDKVMSAFAAGDIDVLVATTVIEVGIDVPEANVMIIENAERFGLAQLHQLRGRIGRAGSAGDCVLLYEGPLSSMARQRLDVMRKTLDGFAIAEHDLKLRGPGELLGARQTGLPEMRIANLVRDRRLLPKVRQAAERLLCDYPDAVPDLLKRWHSARAEYADA